jgi:mannose-6-phosphate isomerase-like protein (cupin superfamily)
MRELLIAAALAIAVPAAAQTPVRSTPPDGYIFKSHAEIDKAASVPEPGMVYGATIINDHENYYVEFVKRQDHGNMVELHRNWIDQVTILEGEGTLTYGGTISNPQMRSNGDVRGGEQVGAKTQALHPGDFVLVPAGMPHTFTAAPGKTLSYVVYKARS